MEWTEADLDAWRDDWTWATRSEREEMLYGGDVPDYVLVCVYVLGWPMDVDLAHPRCRERAVRAVRLCLVWDTVLKLRKLLSVHVEAVREATRLV